MELIALSVMIFTIVTNRYDGTGGPVMGSMQALGQLPSAITASVRDLFKLMDKKSESEISPLNLLLLFRLHYPQFAEKDENGYPLQQVLYLCRYIRFIVYQFDSPGAEVRLKLETIIGFFKKWPISIN